ncbi:MAG: hypothetical protein PHF64_07585 [Methanoregula sp.]|nr:hypothetical protein [Methanoregula sp.]
MGEIEVVEFEGSARMRGVFRDAGCSDERDGVGELTIWINRLIVKTGAGD